MQKKRLLLLVVIAMWGMYVPSACFPGKDTPYQKYQADFADVFNTSVTFTAYTQNRQTFEQYAEYVHQRMTQLHQYFDIYNDYEGINNIKTLNDQAGGEAVLLDGDIMQLLLFAQRAYDESQKTVNIALGPVLSIWHEYRAAGMYNDNGTLPPMDALEKAALVSDMRGLVLDEENQTAHLSQPDMRLDVGALAKGFAVQLTVTELKEQGAESFLLNAGGNVATVGKPLDGYRNQWGIGVQNPEKEENDMDNNLDVIFLSDLAVVTSGDYHRFYVVDGKRYCHIIDPNTLMPAQLYRSVSVIHPDSGVADMLSTALFILPYEQGLALAEKYEAAVLWIMPDLSLTANERYKALSKHYAEDWDAQNVKNS